MIVSQDRGIEVAKQISFCYGHRLLEYQGPCANLHGHTGTAEVIFASGALSTHPENFYLNELGILVDFSEVKNKVKAWIDSNWDHAMLLNVADVAVIELVRKLGMKHFIMPNGWNPTSELMASTLAGACEELFKDNLAISLRKVSIYEGPSSVASVTFPA